MNAGDDLRGQRSAAPRVFGVISLLLSLPFVAILLLSMIGTERMVTHGRATVREVRGPTGPSYRLEVGGRHFQADKRMATSALFIGSLTLTLFGALSLLLFVVAIGQLRYKSWGRTLALTWAFLALCFIALLLLMLMPELSLRIRDVAEHALRGNFRAAEAIVRVPWTLPALAAGLLAIYPLLTLFVFVQPHTKASMR